MQSPSALTRILLIGAAALAITATFVFVAPHSHDSPTPAWAVNETFSLVGAPYLQAPLQGSVTRTVKLTTTEQVHGYTFKIDYDETLIDVTVANDITGIAAGSGLCSAQDPDRDLGDGNKVIEVTCVSSSPTPGFTGMVNVATFAATCLRIGTAPLTFFATEAAVNFAVIPAIGTDSSITCTDPDTDGDGLTDGTEVHSTATDPLDPDTDDDDLSDGAEVNTVGTSPLLADTDGDNCDDGNEVANQGQSLPDDPLDATDYPDLNGNGAVDLGDFILVLSHWNTVPTSPTWFAPADVDDSGRVGFTDFIFLLRSWGRLCSM